MEIRNIETFLPFFDGIRERTLRVVSLIPDDKLEWRHSEGVFSPADLARHIAAVERYTFAENVTGRPSRYPGCGRDLADGKSAILEFMQRMHAEFQGFICGHRCTSPARMTLRRGLNPIQ